MFQRDFNSYLTLTWVGFLGVRFQVGGEGEGKITPCLNLIRIMLETSSLARKYVPICSSRKYTWNYDNFFYKGLTRNAEIGSTSCEFCPISGDWGKL